MTPGERKRLNQERAKLKGYRNQLIAMKEYVPNMDKLMGDNEKLIEFFESGKAAELKANSTIKPSKQTEKVRNIPKVKKELTVQKFLELKVKGLSDRKIMADFGVSSNKLTNWKKANGLVGVSKAAYQEKLDKEAGKMATVVAEVKVDSMEELQKVIQALKSKIDVLQLEKENAHAFAKETEQQLHAQNLNIRELEASLEDSQGNISKYIERAEIANKAERQAIADMIVYQEDYRKLEVDFRNQSSEIEKLKNDIEYLKPYQHMSLVVMERYLTENKRFDAFVEAHKW